MDFTITTYRNLLFILKQSGYQFFTFEEYCTTTLPDKYVILRHDIDKKAKNALITSDVENELKIRSTYYFKVTKKIFNHQVINKLLSIKAEVGYHYRDLVDCKGDYEQAIISFKKNIEKFKQFSPVKTIAMDGCPLSNIDNRDLWKKYNYKDYGILGEPYFDINFDEVFYLTDTARCWDGEKYNVRDRVKSTFLQTYHSTNDIIQAVAMGTLPNKIMITTHPQRWTNNKFEWLIELIAQNIKNKIKRIILRIYA